jgi:hypothetical protein
MFWSKTKHIVPLLLTAVYLGGCAFGTRQVPLTYPPAVDKTGSPAAQTPHQVPKNGVEVIIESFEDNRTVTHRIGNVRNALGMDTADVVATNNVRNWAVKALEWELDNAGYSVVKSASIDNKAGPPVMVSGAVNTIYCDVYFTYEGRAAVVLKVMRNGEVIVNSLYTGEGSAGTNWAASEEGYNVSLGRALQDALKKFINELNVKVLKK